MSHRRMKANCSRNADATRTCSCEGAFLSTAQGTQAVGLTGCVCKGASIYLLTEHARRQRYGTCCVRAQVPTCVQDMMNAHNCFRFSTNPPQATAQPKASPFQPWRAAPMQELEKWEEWEESEVREEHW